MFDQSEGMTNPCGVQQQRIQQINVRRGTEPICQRQKNSLHTYTSIFKLDTNLFRRHAERDVRWVANLSVWEDVHTAAYPSLPDPLNRSQLKIPERLY